MMRRQESYLGCGQMLVAVPAGGRWAHPSQALPVSLFSVAEKATDGVRRFHSGPNAASSVRPAFSHPSLRATCQGNMQAMPGLSPPPPQGSTAYREGSPCRLDLPQTLYCLPVDVSIHCIFALKSCVSWGISFFRQNMPSQGLSAMPALKLLRLQASCKQLIFYKEIERESREGPDLDMLYMSMWMRVFSKECFGWFMWIAWQHNKGGDWDGRWRSKGHVKTIKHWSSSLGGHWPLCQRFCEQSMRKVVKKKQSELIRDSLRSEAPSSVVRLDLLLTSCSFVC